MVFLFPAGETADDVPEAFPAAVAVEERRTATPPLRAIPTKRQAVRMLRSIERVWQPLFAQAGGRYEPAELELVYSTGHKACDEQGAWAGLYCLEERTIHLDLELSGRYWAYVLAHEVGHHVQELRGVFDATGDEFVFHPRTSLDVSLRQELQAECFAGIWAYATHAPTPPRAFFEDEVGTPAEHRRWYARGRRSGRPSRCNPFGRPV